MLSSIHIISNLFSPKNNFLLYSVLHSLKVQFYMLVSLWTLRSCMTILEQLNQKTNHSAIISTKLPTFLQRPIIPPNLDGGLTNQVFYDLMTISLFPMLMILDSVSSNNTMTTSLQDILVSIGHWRISDSNTPGPLFKSLYETIFCLVWLVLRTRCLIINPMDSSTQFQFLNALGNLSPWISLRNFRL